MATLHHLNHELAELPLFLDQLEQLLISGLVAELLCELVVQNQRAVHILTGKLELLLLPRLVAAAAPCGLLQAELVDLVLEVLDPDLRVLELIQQLLLVLLHIS